MIIVPNQSDTSTTMRGALEKAWETTAMPGESTPPAASPTPEPKSELAPSQEPAVPELESTGTDTGGRDARGRFAKKTGAPAIIEADAAAKPAAGQAIEEEDAKVTAKGAAAPPKAARPAPASWKPEAKKLWGDLPLEAQDEVLRREREVSVTLARAAPGAKLGAELERIIAPYKEMMAFEKSTWQDGLANHLQMSAVVRHGTPQQKAELVAGIMAQYGVAPGDVATAFEQFMQRGGGRQTAPPSPASDPLVQHLARKVQELSAYHEAAIEQQAETGLEEVMALPHFEELRDTMAEILETSLAQTRNMSYQDAYRAALALHPELQEQVVTARLAEREAEVRSRQAEDVARAKKAAASIAPRPGAALGAPRKMDRPTAVRTAVDKFWPSGT
jgi:hypothetical protein